MRSGVWASWQHHVINTDLELCLLPPYAVAARHPSSTPSIPVRVQTVVYLFFRGFSLLLSLVNVKLLKDLKRRLKEMSMTCLKSSDVCGNSSGHGRQLPSRAAIFPSIRSSYLFGSTLTYLHSTNIKVHQRCIFHDL